VLGLQHHQLTAQRRRAQHTAARVRSATSRRERTLRHSEKYVGTRAVTHRPQLGPGAPRLMYGTRVASTVASCRYRPGASACLPHRSTHSSLVPSSAETRPARPPDMQPDTNSCAHWAAALRLQNSQRSRFAARFQDASPLLDTNVPSILVLPLLPQGHISCQPDLHVSTLVGRPAHVVIITFNALVVIIIPNALCDCR
jgi:hypothetical protein